MPPLDRRGVISLLAAPAALGLANDASGAPRKPEQLMFEGTAEFPNSRLPVLVYRQVLLADELDRAARFETLFEQHGWTGSWRNGLYRVHHYHSTAHEVLGIYRGWVKARLGGPSGKLVTLSTGDVAVLPAGVAHKNEEQSGDFAVVGAYPRGTSPDMQYGKPAERPATDEAIARVALPERDPVAGASGALLALWR